MELRPEIQWFAEQMERKLQENDHKPGWKEDSIESLLWTLEGKYSKLYLASLFTFEGLKREGTYEKLVSELIDVGNYAMMIADNANRKT